MKNLVVFGATSEIAHECIKQFVTNHEVGRVLMIARSGETLQKNSADLGIRFGVTVETLQLDLSVSLGQQQLRNSIAEFGVVNFALVAQGVLNDQIVSSQSASDLAQEIQVNCFSVASSLELLAEVHQRQIETVAVGIFGSVAGDRIRRKNYSYGATKRYVEAYVDGIRHRFAADRAITFTLIKPGPTKTKMTLTHAGHNRMADPRKVAEVAVRAIVAGKKQVYAPRIWGLIMLVIRSIPSRLFGLVNF